MDARSAALVAVDPVVEAALEMVASDSGEWNDVDWHAMNDCWRKACMRTTQAGLYLEESEVVACLSGSDDRLIFEVTSAGLLYEEWLVELIAKHAPKSWRTWRGKVREGCGYEQKIVRRVLTHKGKQAQRSLEHDSSDSLRLLLSVYYSKVGQPKPNLLREPQVQRSKTESTEAATENAVCMAAAQANATGGDVVVNTKVENVVDLSHLADAFRDLLKGSAAAAPTEATSAGSRPATVNERMLAEWHRNPKDSLDWSAQRWAEELGCSKSTVSETDAWKTIQRAREQSRTDRSGRS